MIEHVVTDPKARRISDALFDYIAECIENAVEYQELHGGGMKMDNEWNLYRQMYDYYLARGNAAGMPGAPSRMANNPDVNFTFSTINRQRARMRYIHPLRVDVKAMDAESYAAELDVMNAINFYMNDYERFDFPGEYNGALLYALVNSYGVARVGWRTEDDFDDSVIECMRPEFFIPDPHLEGMNLDKARFCVETRLYTATSIKNESWYYNLDRVKPNIVNSTTNSVEDIDRLKKELPRQFKHHRDSIIVDWFYDGANKTITAIPRGHDFEIGHRDWPNYGFSGYPFEIMMFNPVPWGFYGPPDIAMYDVIARNANNWERILQAIAKADIPKLLADRGSFSDDERQQLVSGRPWDLVMPQLKMGARMSDLVYPLQTSGVSQSHVIGADRMRNLLNEMSGVSEIERTGQPLGADTATEAQIADMHSKTMAAFKQDTTNVFTSRCAKKVHAMMTKNFTKFRSMGWVIDRKPLDRIERHFHRVDRKTLEGNYSFRIDAKSEMARAIDKKTMTDFLAIATRLPPQFLVARDSAEYILKEVARRHDMNEMRINLERPKMPMGPGAMLPGGPQGPGSGNAFSREGGAAMAGAEAIPGAMGL